MEPLRDPNPKAAHTAAMAAHILESFGRIPYLLWGHLAVRLAGGRDLSNPHLPDNECSFIIVDADLKRAVQVLMSGGFLQCTVRWQCRYRLGVPGARLTHDAHLHTSEREEHDTCLLLYNQSRIIPDLNGAMGPGPRSPHGPLVPYMFSSDPNTVPPRDEDRGSGYWRGLWPVRALKPNVLTVALLDCVLRDYATQGGQILGEWLALLVRMIEPAYPPTMRLPPRYRALWRACNSRVVDDEWQATFLAQLVCRNYEYIPRPDEEEENDDDVARRANFMVSRTQFVNDGRWL
ncbi:hypothetical protein BP00DRAFT_454200 [Aspergillus indologenus CBS 114.80]|uniref:Uncharacterized protein n=1 Tax=Aspergillus indologenus CBS 114.80 TaxID=1450541 RepID=A0A2V5IDX2_9EURO|nr:hypothetical protein BP00DRAFT_454200 [Aspergillus indologenus CBS 114.80]